MPLNNIHEWVDDEVISHDDLNSIGEAVSQAVGSGNIAPTQLTWPLLAQGDIDMNGYTIRNIDALSGVIHVNDEKTLADAIDSAVNGTIIIIDSGVTNIATAQNLELDGLSNVSILGSGGGRISISAACTTAGIRVKSNCTGIIIDGISFTGGTANVPALLIEGSDVTVTNCSFDINNICCQIGSTSSNAVGATVVNNKFVGVNSPTGIRGKSMQLCRIVGNRFYSLEEAIRLPGDGDGSVCNFNNISGNRFQYCSYGIVYDKLGTPDDYRGNNVYANNIFFTSVAVALDMYGYYKECIVGNIISGSANISGNRATISDNVFNNNCTVDGDYTLFKDNVIYGSFAITTASAVSLAKCMVVGNAFHGSSAMDSKVQWYEGNMFYVLPTVSGSDAYTDLSNWRKT